MDRQRLDVDDLHVERGVELDERADAELGQVLVVDRVELVPFHQVERVRNLDHERAGLVEERAHTVHERMEVVDVVQRVGGEYHRGRPVIGPDRSRRLRAEVVVDDVDALLTCDRRQVGGRFDAEHTAAAPPRAKERKSPSLEPMSTSNPPSVRCRRCSVSASSSKWLCIVVAAEGTYR